MTPKLPPLTALLLFALAANTAQACRCAERPFAEYFAAADTVFVATLNSTTAIADGQREFRFSLQGEPYKFGSAIDREASYVSHTSSAACAVEVDIGATYIVFADYDEQSNVGWLTSCNGTRIHRRSDGTTLGFSDVPDRFVLSQLAALGGLDVLQKIAAVEPKAGNPDGEALLGLIDVSVFAHGGSADVYPQADESSEHRSKAQGYEDLAHRESGYEVDAAEVFARVDGWHKVRLSSGKFGWLAPESAGSYWPLEELLPNRLNYLTANWDRYVWPNIGAGIPIRVPYAAKARPREQPAKITGAQRIADSLWLQVEVLAESPCSGNPETIVAGGWIPAYGRHGEPVAWFYSRGC